MLDDLYNKKIECPVCMSQFEATKVRTKAIKVASRDADFCVYYEGTNPMFYDIQVCENCGYAASSDKFEQLGDSDRKKIKENISPRWNKRSFAGERNIDAAIETFKLALLNLHVRNAKNSEKARICLRIAWMYRLKKDEKEKEFLQFTLNCYKEIYEKERLPADKLDEVTCMYMIAELNRRVGNFDESVKWFSRMISSPEARKNASLLEKARDQFQLAKDQNTD
ncbi:MAG: DUF2225 domain-containing protein [Bacillota bacterium]|nr:DUF2225 domain-containing protein [Bacillota bacterium]